MKPYHFALIGSPIAHSLSPQIHALAAAQVGLDADYALRPLDAHTLEGALPDLRALDGFNVTTPLKEAILPHLDDRSAVARRLGAVNTVRCQEGGLWGTNTDLEGFERGLPERLEGRALVLGAGGAARPVFAALAARGLELIVLNRTPSKARGVLDALEIEGAALGLDALSRIEGASILVNTLPRGALEPAALPLERLEAGALVYDLDYRADAPLLATARRAGLATMGGLVMLVYQALAAFEQWTGRAASAPPILEALRASRPARRDP